MGIKDDEGTKQTTTNLHMLGCLRGFNVAMLLLIIVGISCEGHKFRGKLAMAETALFVTTGIDAYRQGLMFQVPAVTAIVGFIGAALNQLEPGIFTKSKKQD